jgi:hypothetical protein
LNPQWQNFHFWIKVATESTMGYLIGAIFFNLRIPMMSNLPVLAAFAASKNAKRELSFLLAAARVAGKPEGLKGGGPAR